MSCVQVAAFCFLQKTSGTPNLRQSPASPYKDLHSLPEAACARFVVDRMAMGQAILRTFGFPPPNYCHWNFSMT
jgi:hypothetical protein